MAALKTTTTIRIKVPDQEFSAILLVVSSTTTLNEVHHEIRSQLGLDCSRSAMEYRKTCLRAQCIDTRPDPIHFFMNWSVKLALDNGAGDFELIYTDVCA